MRHVMLDLEALSLSPNGVILSVGAVVFDEKQVGAKHYERLPVEPQQAMGRDVNFDTLSWWAEQSDAARKEAFNPNRPRLLNDTLVELSRFLRDSYVWANGAGFDLPMLRSLYMQAGLDVPWQHRNERCYRTMMAAHPVPKVLMEGSGLVPHHALDDAVWQAEMLQASMRKHAWSLF